ncbi:hypothetical protein PBAL39_03629 [Pedobacter sp. BAL39]|uniref:DUF7935 family protein n=1 Tax=Pedobacter sp. BAL39 TaxID=391596 RepID=UPI0001559227|nr:hypothetical protein [Pedobacter sp. BAL39]EDM35601.1 hypothetical protein PBAL39_03629 [Pedobacter sp. BAL39]
MNTDLITAGASIAIGGAVTVTLGYYLVRNDIQAFLKLKTPLRQKDDGSDHLLSLRLQAHERLIIFIERINPSNLLLRLHHQGIAVKDLQVLILNEIKAEYQHNVTQQLYVSAEVWNVVRQLKDDTLAMVNNAVEGLPPQATGVDLSRKVLQKMSVIEENPYDLTLDLIKKDIHRLF